MSTEIEGINYGDVSIEDKLLVLKSHRLDKPILSLKLDNISTCVIPTTNKDDVEIQFQETDFTSNRDDHQVIQITFHFPSKKDQVDDEDEDEPAESEAEKFHKTVNQVGVLSSVTGDIIVEFTREQGNFVTPRGKYALQMTSTYVYMQGAQYFYKIGYNEINSLFLLPKLDGGRMAFVIALEKPIRQGNQKYQYLVIETHRINAEITVNLTEEEIARDYDGQLEPVMDMPLCNLIAKVFKVLSKKSVFVPKHFVTSRNGHAVRCSLKANDGLLYPLAKAFIFINKPTVYIKFEDIEIIDFKRYDQNAATRNFDLVITLKSSAVSSNEPKEYNFSSIDRAEFPALMDYIQSKEIPVNRPEEVAKPSAYLDDDDDDDIKGNDDDSLDSEEADDDYVAGDDPEDSGSDSGSDDEDGNDGPDDEEAKSKKRKASSSSSKKASSKKSKSNDD